MLKGFEEYTYELTEYEANILLPLFVKSFSGNKHRGKDKRITNPEICKLLHAQGYDLPVDKNGGSPRVRKIIAYIRGTGLIPGLAGTSKGYYVTTDVGELKDWLSSLEGRINSLEKQRSQAIKLINSLEKNQ